MLDNVMRGHLYAQTNKGTALTSRVSRASDLPSLREIEKAYTIWNEETLHILQSGFASSYQSYYREFGKIFYLGSVLTSPFEKLRDELDSIIPQKTKLLTDLIANLGDIPKGAFLPVELPQKETVEEIHSAPHYEKRMPASANNIPLCDYVIITALEIDEMEKVLSLINSEGFVDNKKHLIGYGTLKSNPKKRIAFASQQSTGMVDAGILSAELLILFKPKYLIMAGVLGGKPGEVKIGDVVVATKVFTIDKGKISDLGFRKEANSSSVDGAYITNIIRNKRLIQRFIEDADPTRNRNVDIHFGPIGCVGQVIDLEGYFEEFILTEDRKAIALEMESYGVKRACELVNNGETSALIIKAAMDNTVDKVDDAKSYAAYNSAKFVEYILQNNII